MPNSHAPDDRNTFRKAGGPGAGDVHVDAPLGGKKKLPVGDAAEEVGEVTPDDEAIEKSFSSFFKVSGVDEGLGLVFGWGIVCKEAGVDYVDVQGNHIPEDAMVEATTEFMKSSRQMGEMHVRMDAGAVVHSFPLTTEIAKAMGITTEKTGWMIAAAPDKAMLAKFASGEYSGFSIGGEHIEIDGKPFAEAA